MEISAIVEAAEVNLAHHGNNKNVERVSFYIYNSSIVISGLDKSDNVVKGVQIEIDKDDAIKIANLILNNK